MGNFLYMLAVMLLLLWSIGYIGYGANGIFHLLLAVAVLALLLRFVRGDKTI